MTETFVLVHGGWHGGWCWRETAAHIRAQGHQVTTPTLTGLGERVHLMSRGTDLHTMIDDIINHLIWEDLFEVTLVGHSYAGCVLTGVADRVPERLRRLIYMDTLWLTDGQCATDLMPADTLSQRLQASADLNGGIALPVPPPEAFGIETEPERSMLLEKLTPHPLASCTSKLSIKHPPGNGLPMTYIACTAPAYPVMAESRRAAEAAGVAVKELAAPHDAMIARPAETADLLMRVAAGD